MKKAIKINLSGSIFHIDEDAYDKLKFYLDRISSHFSNKEESKEIIDDIEARIAELFHEKITKESEVITIDVVNEVIAIMGDPSEFADSGAEEGQKSQYTNYSYTTKRLYRDPEDAVFGGVCGGLAAYLHADPLLIRVLAIILFFFGGVTGIIYIVLWIALPKAETAAQKLEMRGEAVNVSNIEKKIREEYEGVKNNINNAVKSEPVQRTRRAANDFFHALGRIILVFFKVVLILIGTGFILTGISLLIALLTGTFWGLSILPFGPYDFSLGEFLAPFSDPTSLTLLIIALSLLILIPLIAMIYGLIKLIFQVKSTNRSLAVGATTLWIISLITLIGILAFESTGYSKSGEKEFVQNLEINADTIYIDINDIQEKALRENALFELGEEWYFTEEEGEFFGRIKLDIEPAEGKNIRLETVKRSKGRSFDVARENASNLNYNYSLKGNHLVLDPYFQIEAESQWRFPAVRLTLQIPEGKVVVLDRNSRELLHDVENTKYYSSWELGGKTLRMTDRGLEPLESKAE